MSRLPIVSALEALEVGDTRLAADILLGALEELDDGPAPAKQQVCGNCGKRFRWPGELEDHHRNVHWGEPWKRAA